VLHRLSSTHHSVPRQTQSLSQFPSLKSITKGTNTALLSSADAAPANSTYFGTVYAAQVHAVDMAAFDGDAQDVIASFDKGLSLFTSALDKWLPAFKPGASSNATSTATTTEQGSSSSDTASNSKDDTKKNAALPRGLPSAVAGFVVVAAALANLA
jgi:hypothetical protein